jgi:aminopeptidase-like protein
MAATLERELSIGARMHGWASDLFPICRSLTGPGVRQTLEYLSDLFPGLQVKSIPSGTRVFDWIVPDEWTIRDAFILDESGNRRVDFRENNLHVVGYSTPVDGWFTREELEPHLHSLPDQPDAVPFVTSYYAPNWGFCLAHRERIKLERGRYRVVIDSDLGPGVMNYGELVLPGRQTSEILLSTNICHPSMANNELSGPVVQAALARWLTGLESRRHTYRLLFLPETIGAIAYLSRHLEHMKRFTIAGFVLTCAGDNRTFSYVPSRSGDTLADRVALHVLARRGSFRRYRFLDRGSDERQYCSPGVDLPVCSVMRSKYVTYPEYHTSLDDLSLISPEGLTGTFEVLRKCLMILEANQCYRASVPCEPQLGRHGLYPELSRRQETSERRPLLDVLAYADGRADIIDIAEKVELDALECAEMLEALHRLGLVQAAESRA